MKSIAIALLAAFAIVSVAPSHSYAEQNNILMEVSTTRLKAKSNNGASPQQAPISTSRSNKKHGAPINTSRSNKKHGIRDEVVTAPISGAKR